MPRWLGIDFGTVRIGVAAGDTETALAAPLEVLPSQPRPDAVDRLAQLTREHDAAGLAIGWPLNMDDTEGPQGRLTREFAADLAEQTGLDVRLWDERLSSFVADEALAGTMTRKKRKARQDAIAAAAILQDFLSQDGPQVAPTPSKAAEQVQQRRQ